MHSQAFLSMSSLRLACMLGIILSVTMHTTRAEALPQPKVAYTYSLEVPDGGSYRQKIDMTPLGAGDVDYIVDSVSSGDPKVTVFVDNPLVVTIEFTADAPGGNIVDGPVELLHTYFEREFEIDTPGVSLVHTTISTVLSRIATGTLTGSTIAWENVVAPYQEDVIGGATCTGFGCAFASVPFPRDLSGTFDVPLPDFTLFTISTFGDSFVSDNGTPSDILDDIVRPDPDARVRDTWSGVSLPEPSGEVLLLAGALLLAGLDRLRSRGGAPALFANRR